MRHLNSQRSAWMHGWPYGCGATSVSMLPLQSDYSLRAVCRYCLCFSGWWRMKWPMMQLHTWLTWFRQTLVWPTCGEDNTASVCTPFTQHGSELLHSSVSFVSHCLFVCRLISNRFTVEGIRQLAEALAHNKALKEIWWASVQIDILVFCSPLKVMSDQAEGGWLFEVQLILDTNLS